MCVTTLSAQLSETRIGVWDVQHPEFGYRHVMAYQNSVLSEANEANCMLLQVPCLHALLPEHIINTADDVELLINMETSFFPACRSFAAQNHIVEMGVYHIALLNDTSPDALAAALEKIPEEKQPAIPTEYLEFYALLFPGFPLLLCCFNNQDRLAASPIMVHFDPLYKDYFMFNTLDGHGSLPNIYEQIKFHQTIISGSYRLNEEKYGFKAFDHSKVSKALLPWLPKFGTAFKLTGIHPNRDLLLSTRAFTEQKVNPEFGILNRDGLSNAA